MEYQEDENQIVDSELRITYNSSLFLGQIGKWTLFISILGMITILFFILCGFSIGLFMPDNIPNVGLSPMGIMLTYWIIAILYVMPVYYMYNFSTNVKEAVQTKNSQILETAFANLKSYYKYIGILLIISIVVSILSLLALVFVVIQNFL